MRAVREVDERQYAGEKGAPSLFTLIENGEVLSPEPLGRQSLLLAGGVVVKIGAVERRDVSRLGVELEIVDADGCFVTPGLIDPHEHLLGGSGEQGYSSQTPEISAQEILLGGITTVVGCLGVDTSLKAPGALVGKAKALREEGLTAYVFSGGYSIPPTTLLPSIREDLLYISEVIGAGEIAISDQRAMDPTAEDLARLVSDVFVGGMLSRKAGVTHFHVGEGPRRLALLRALLDEFDIAPESLYPTHVQRTEALMLEAMHLAGRGATIDVDTVDEDLPRWLGFFKTRGGDMRRITVSSDASVPAPRTLYEQLVRCVREEGWTLSEVLPMVTVNTAAVLKLGGKGRLRAGADADLIIVDKGTLEIRDVVARGRRLVKDGVCLVPDPHAARAEWVSSKRAWNERTAHESV